MNAPRIAKEAQEVLTWNLEAVVSIKPSEFGRLEQKRVEKI